MTAVTSRGRAQALVERIVLIALVIGATGLLVGVMLVPSAVLASDALDFVAGDLFDVGPLPEAENPPENSYIYAADGSELAEINFRENREPVALEDVPQVVVNAIIATEDEKFYEHHGINLQAIARAGLSNVQAGDITGGGSTITQQYVKNAFLSDRATEQSLDRKIIEAVWAVELEERLDKDQILERYLNRTYFGAGAYGIGTAAQRYYSKTVGDLTLEEAATLAGVIRSPERNNPIENPDNARGRRNIVLDQMADQGYITEHQRDAAKEAPLEVSPSEIPPPEYPFWTEWVTRLLTNERIANGLGSQIDAMQLMGDTIDERIATVFQGGLRIHTTLDPGMQAAAEAAIVEHLTAEDATADQIAQEPMGGIVSVEPGTGAIRTMALGPYEYGSCAEDEEWPGRTEAGELLCHKTKVNPLFPGGGGSGRHPGSSFKPFVISAALEAGLPPGWQVNADSGQPIEGCTANGEPYAPANAGRGGTPDMYEGVKYSINVYHAKLAAEIGPETVADMAGRLGLRNWINHHQSTDPPFRFIGCSIGLGSTEVSPLEMASAYATFANRGQWCAPFAITKIEDRNGNVIYQQDPHCEQAVDSSVIDRVVDIMQGPVTPGGTAGGMTGTMSPYPVRGKTGTTDDSRDAWFVGYIKQLATAAWIGYPNGERVYESAEAAAAVCPEFHDGQDGPADYPEGVFKCPPVTKVMQNVTIGGDPFNRVYGATIPAPMWASYMTQVVDRYEPADFDRPGPVPGTTVPDLLAAPSIAEAEAMAEEAGLNLMVLSEVDYRPEGTPLRQEPPAGSPANAGNAVLLYISDGTGEVPAVPDVIGRSQAEATQILEEAGYRVLPFTKPTSNPGEVGIVLGQSPGGGEQIAPPGDVLIQVGVEPPSGGGGGDGGGDDDDDDDGGPGNGNGNGNGRGGGGGDGPG